MSMVAPMRLRVEKDIITRVTRSLNGSGRINANIGQQVTPEEIIGTATLSSGFRVLNLSLLLSVASRDLAKYLTKKLGERIYKGELLACKRSWLGKKVVISPTDGILESVNTQTGELKITLFPKKINLPAGVYGIVEKVDNERGQAIIRTQVSRVYGILGSGKLRDGMLCILRKKDELVAKSAIEAKYEGQILVGGSLFFREAIISAISEGVKGIITGGINASDYKGLAGGSLEFPRKLETDIGISMVICEGFGSIPIGNDIFDLLQQYEERFVFIDGNRAVVSLPSCSSASLIKIKSTELPSLQNELIENNQHINQIVDLKVGLKVRIVGNSYLGEQGKIIAIDNSLTLLPSGIKSYLATVDCATRKIQVPVANLEIIL